MDLEGLGTIRNKLEKIGLSPKRRPGVWEMCGRLLRVLLDSHG